MGIMILEKILLWLLIVVGVLGISGIVYLVIVAKKKKSGIEVPPEDDPFSQKTVENVADLNDRFNRARYMNEDGN